MIILLFIIFLTITIVGLLVLRTRCDYTTYVGLEILTCFSIIISVCLLVYMCDLILKVGTEHTIDQKIAMYEDQNASIENSIGRIVTNYINHEKDTHTELKSKDLVTLATMFSELKSDNLVQEQIEICVDNKEKIKKIRN